MRRILITTILALMALFPVAVMAQDIDYFGTYDESKMFIDANDDRIQCWIQPDGTVYIDLVGEKMRVDSATYIAPETATDQNGKVYKITGLGKSIFNAFNYVRARQNINVTKVVLPESYNTIENAGFYGPRYLYLEELDAPGITRFGDYIFSGGGGGDVSLRKVNMPKLKIIGAYAFNNCYHLEEANFPELEEARGPYCFYGCNTLEKMDFPKLKKLTDCFAFGCSNLKEINMPSVTDIVNPNVIQFGSPSVFMNDRNLERVNLPSLKHLYQLFSTTNIYPKLKYINLSSVKDSYVTGFDGLIDVDTLILPNFEAFVSYDGKEFQIPTFEGYSWLRTPNKLKYLYMPKFHQGITREFFRANADSLQYLYAPKAASFTYSDEIKSLKKVVLSSATSFNCSNATFDQLDSLTLPAATSFTAQNAKFNKFTYLNLPVATDVHFEASTMDDLKTLLIPSAPTFNMQSASMKGLEYLDISSVQQFNPNSGWDGSDASVVLRGTDNLKHLVCHNMDVVRQFNAWHDLGVHDESDGVINLDNYNANCSDYTSLETVELMHQPAEMGDEMFNHLPNIKHLVIHGESELKNPKALSLLNNLETIEVAKDETQDYSSTNGVLYDKAGSTLLYYPRANETATDSEGNKLYPFGLPATLKSVGDYAFYGYPRQHQIAFGRGLESIGAHAFDGSHINRVTFDPVTPLKTVGDYAFANMTEDYFKYLKFPTSLETIGEGAFSGDTQLQAIELYDSKLTTVPKSAFAGLTNITSIALPNTVATIGENAFDGNTAMEYFTVPTACTNIGANAFNGTALKVLNIPNVNASLTSSLAAAFPSTKPGNIFVPKGQSVSLSGSTTTQELSKQLEKNKFYSFTRSYPVDLSDAAKSVDAFIVSNYNVDATTGKGVLYTESLSKEQLSNVPANTPIILLAKSVASTPVIINYSILDSEPASIGNSLVNGAPGAIRIDNKVSINGNDYNSYVLQWAESGENASGVFVPVTAKEWYEVSTRKGEQSYLQLPSMGAGGAVASAKYFTLSVGTTPTGISTIPQNGASNNDVWYNLQGQRVSTPAHGIYIHNGKKVVKQ